MYRYSFILILLVLLLSSCSGQTQYQMKSVNNDTIKLKSIEELDEKVEKAHFLQVDKANR